MREQIERTEDVCLGCQFKGFEKLRFLIIAGLLGGLLPVQADAKTIRYEFDIVASAILFQGSLEEYDSWSSASRKTIMYDDPLYQQVVSAIHPLGDLAGQTGRVTMQLQSDPGQFPSLVCFGGFLCPIFNRMDGAIDEFSQFDATGFSLYAWAASPSGEWYLSSVTGEDRLAFTDDQVAGRVEWNDKYYQHGGARASFSLINTHIYEVSTVPLPAAAPLLAAGILILGAVRARRRVRQV